MFCRTNNTIQAYHGVSVNFPAFSQATPAQVLSWGGSFMPPTLQSSSDVFEKGQDTGLPAVFFDSATATSTDTGSNSAAGPAFVFSALDHFFAASTSSNLQGKNSTGDN
jgi:hypothetical protein